MGMYAPRKELLMSRRSRLNHAPAFNAKVALKAIKGEHTLAKLAQRHDVHPNQITQWKNAVAGAFRGGIRLTWAPG